MDSNAVNQSWNNVCEKIKTYEGVTPSQVDAFFSRIHPQAMSEGFLMLTADNQFIKFFIEREFLPHIKRALEEQFSVPFTVMLEVDPLSTDNTPLQNESISQQNLPTQQQPITQSEVSPLSSPSQSLPTQSEVNHLNHFLQNVYYFLQYPYK